MHHVNFQVDWNLVLRHYCCFHTVHVTREVSEVFLALLGYILAARSLTYSSLGLEKLSSLARKSEEELELSSSMSLLAISERILSVMHVTK